MAQEVKAIFKEVVTLQSSHFEQPYCFLMLETFWHNSHFPLSSHGYNRYYYFLTCFYLNPCNPHQNSLSRIPTFQLKKSEDAIPLLGQDGFHRLFSLVQFSHSVMSDSLRHHESQHTKPPCPSPTPGAYSNSCPLSQWCHPAISSSVDHTTK